MSTERPPRVGAYRLMRDFDSRSASVRIIHMDSDVEAVQPHVHQRSTQIYIPLVGRVRVHLDGVETVVEQYHCFLVPIGSAHGVRPADADEDVLVMNISVPPLAADDQVGTGERFEPRDFRLPVVGSDFDD